MSVLKDALRYLNMKFSVIPLRPNSKLPLIKWEEFQRRRMTPDEAVQYFGPGQCNVGIVTGPISRLVVFDADDEAAWQFLQRYLCETSVCYSHAKTPHGNHAYLRMPDAVLSNRTRIGDMRFDVRGKGGYVAAPPSRLDDGVYEWVDEQPPSRLSLPPDVLLQALQTPAKHLDPDTVLRFGVGQGQRDEALFHAACYLFRRGIAEAEVMRQVQEAAARCTPPFPPFEARKVVESAGKRCRQQGDRKTDEATGDRDASMALTLLNLAGGLELFPDEHGEEHVALHGCAEPIRGGRKLEQFLIRAYHQKRQGIASVDSLNRVRSLLAAQGAQQPRRRLHLRVAPLEGGTLMIDCVNTNNECVIVDGSGWRIARIEKPLFRRKMHQRALVLPARGGDAQEFFKVVNVPDEDHQLLLWAWVCTAFLEHIPRPLLVFQGQPGAAKSSAARMVKDLIDPSEQDGIGMPQQDEDLARVLGNNHMPFFDNVSGVTRRQADMLCRAATGGALSTRVLYTTAEDHTFKFRRPVLITSVHPLASAQDLADRCLCIEFQRIREGDRRAESAVHAGFAQARPRIFGAVLDCLSRAIKLQPTLKFSRLQRMADFTQWGAAAVMAAGFDPERFLAAYENNIAERSRDGLEMHPVGRALARLMNGRSEWVGTAAELLTVLNGVTFGRDVRRLQNMNPAELGRALTGLTPALEGQGIAVDRSGRGARQRRLVLTNSRSVTPVTVVSVADCMPQDTDTHARRDGVISVTLPPGVDEQVPDDGASDGLLSPADAEDVYADGGCNPVTEMTERHPEGGKGGGAQ